VNTLHRTLLENMSLVPFLLAPYLLIKVIVGVLNPGVPGPTSKLSPRAPAQMGRRETEREGGKKPEGDRRER
jgi:hypothetical protein